MKRLLLAGLLSVFSMDLAFADNLLGLTDSGNFSSGDYIVIDQFGLVVAEGGSVSGTVVFDYSTIAIGGPTFTGSVGNYSVKVTGGIFEDGLTLYFGGIGTSASSPPLDILLTESVAFNSNGTPPVGAWA